MTSRHNTAVRAGARAVRAVCVVLTTASAACASASCSSRPGPGALPNALSAQGFWTLSESLSELAGEFRHSENLVSNEAFYPYTVHMLRRRGGVYVGVGPEQNFSYIARLQPDIAFIVDIRNENRHLHLIYKALFDISTDRAAFVARLFSRELPVGLDQRASVDGLFTALAAGKASTRMRDETVQLVRQALVGAYRLPLSEHDLLSIERILAAFHEDGPDIHYGRSLPATAAGPSYRTLMTASDARGVRRSYLASEDAFAFVKQLHARHLIVPVVGNFSGRHTLKSIGDYVRRHDAVVTAFYGSNVQVYLSKQEMVVYCTNLDALPYNAATWLIANKGLRLFAARVDACRPSATRALAPR